MILVEDWKLVVLERYAKFDGRAGRAEYWWFFLATFIIVTGDQHPDAGSQVRSSSSRSIYFWLAVLVPSMAVAIRRLHDTNKSGWFLLIGLIPFVGFIILVVLLATPGDPGSEQVRHHRCRDRRRPSPLDRHPLTVRRLAIPRPRYASRA